MPKPKVFDIKNGSMIARVTLASEQNTDVENVHDGDTIKVSLNGNMSLRFLGVDAPEIAFQIGTNPTMSSGDPRWNEYLNNLENTNNTFDPHLFEHLKSRIKSNVAENHYGLAVEARDALENEIKNDIQKLNRTPDNFPMIISFANDVFDGNGRLLGYINCFIENSKERPLSYNERLLYQGKVSPYFIWPNINPFRKRSSLWESIPTPGTLVDVINSDMSFKAARDSVKAAREQKIGIFNEQNPLQIQPFELRFLARFAPPERYALDLTKNDNLILQPQNYYTIENIEDRLFIPPEYVPLFEKKGWNVEGIGFRGFA